MIRQHPLVTHPVGRLSAAARWYLAAIAMLALILIAIHFAMQVYAQQEAKRLVSEWEKSAGISVGDVRYRMLRGALTLLDVRLQANGTDVYAPMVFLHGSLSSLDGAAPKAGYVEIRKAHITLSANAAVGMVDGDTTSLPKLFYTAWGSAKRVGIYDSQFEIPSSPKESFPASATKVSIVALEMKQREGRRDVKALFRLLDGELQLTSQKLWKNKSDQHMGEIVWRGFDAPSLLVGALGLKGVAGQLDGHLTWKDQGTEKGSYSLTGSVALKGEQNGGKTPTVSWQGLLVSGAWIGEIKAVSWPLAPFSKQLPQYQHYKLDSGNLNGTLKFAGDWQAWKIDATNTRFTDVEYLRDEEGELFPKWHLGTLNLPDASLHWPDRIFRAKEIAIETFDFVGDSRGVESSFQDWKMDVKKISLNNVSPSIILSNELFRLPKLSGSAQWQRGDKISFQLKSVETDITEERWKVGGEGVLSSKRGDSLMIDVSAKRAPLVRFRPLLPEQLRKEANGISGTVDLSLNLSAGSRPWEGHGEAAISDLFLEHEGGQLSARHVALSLEEIGTKIAEQLIRQVEIEGWQYQAPLRPVVQSEANGSGITAVALTQAENWHIQSLHMGGGRVTVGNADAVWLQEAEVHIKNLRPGSDATFDLKSELGGGTLVVEGGLHWDSGLPSFYKAKALVRDAVPFFMNEWLSVSGMPQIMRGRVYADLKLTQGEQGDYRGVGYFRLQHGLLGPAHSGKDLFFLRTGFYTQDIFSALHEAGQLRVRIPLQGSGKLVDLLGNSFVAALKADVEKKGAADKVAVDSVGELLSSIRLHEDAILSHNERVRLRNVLAYLRKNPKAMIALYPQLAISSEDQIQTERIRQTQQLIEAFLVKRGVRSSRIFPVWPSEQYRNSSSTSGVEITILR